MKKVLTLFLTVVLLSTLCSAKEAVQSSEGKAPVKNQLKTGELRGTVVSITPEDKNKGAKLGVVSIADGVGNIFSFTVTLGTKIVDTTLNTLTLHQLREGDRVKVEHSSSTAGGQEAEDIRLMH